MLESPKFHVEDWRQYGRLTTRRNPLQIFFLFQLRGEPGTYPVEVRVTGPNGDKAAIWSSQVEFTAGGTAFLEVPFVQEHPQPGRYGLDLIVGDEALGVFPFQLPDS